MRFFKHYGFDFNYEDNLQCDDAFATAHINYGESPIFDGTDSKFIAENSRKDSLSSNDYIDDVLGCICSFDGTEKDFNMADQITLWKNYWLEYINAFDKLTLILPRSVATCYVGRHAIEIGIKYLLCKKGSEIIKTHDLGKLTEKLFSEYNISEPYMSDIPKFCRSYSKFVEGGNVEYFRFPAYRANAYFSGNRLDIRWLSYNFALILIKLLHFGGLCDE